MTTRVWLSFRLNDRRRGAQTDTWEVWTVHEARHVGAIRWYGPWRKYCFFPSSPIWEQDCLRHIAEFIETETAKHRKGNRALSQEVPA